MTELFNFFVSPHAISQFQQRIALTDEDKARRYIQAGVLQSSNRKLIPAKDRFPETLRIRTRRPFPFEFRAFCVFDAARGGWVVATIVRGDSKVTRKQRRGLAPFVSS
jgi:hypothetical protein